MNVDRMRLALKKFIGLHDFRNFCKKDESVKLEEDAFDDD